MVSFPPPFFIQLDQGMSNSESESNSSRKRKWDDSSETEEILSYKPWKNPKGVGSGSGLGSSERVGSATNHKAFSDVELHLETPLPSEWQRCLDIQSGEIHFYNTRTQKRTVRDPRSSPEASRPNDCAMSLDLELNLPCGSLNNNPSSSSKRLGPTTNKKTTNSPPPACADLLISLGSIRKKNEAGIETEDQAVEMVATACMRCHMLVMLCKSSPTCPNCKFVHPPYQSPPHLFKSRLSLSC